MTVVLLQETQPHNGATRIAREIATAKGGPFRAPHYSSGPEALTQELALATGGVLYLDDVQEYPCSRLRALLATWRAMWPGARPILCLGLVTGERQLGKWAPLGQRHIERLADTLPNIDRHEICGHIL